MISIIPLIILILYAIVLWKFAVKTGRPGWSLYIPIYSNYVWCSISGLDIVWCLLSFAPGIVISMYPDNQGVATLASIFSLVIHFNFCRALASRFNKGLGYTLGLFFLQPIFITILTFNKKCYYRGW